MRARARGGPELPRPQRAEGQKGRRACGPVRGLRALCPRAPPYGLHTSTAHRMPADCRLQTAGTVGDANGTVGDILLLLLQRACPGLAAQLFYETRLFAPAHRALAASACAHSPPGRGCQPQLAACDALVRGRQLQGPLVPIVAAGPIPRGASSDTHGGRSGTPRCLLWENLCPLYLAWMPVASIALDFNPTVAFCIPSFRHSFTPIKSNNTRKPNHCCFVPPRAIIPPRAPPTAGQSLHAPSPP